MADDELISQFMAFTGSSDTGRAASYLEMSGGDVETAVGLYMEHQGGGGGGASATAASGSGIGGEDDVRAPDAAQRMRLMDDVGGGMMGAYGGMMGNPYMPMVDPMIEQEFLRNTAFGPRSALHNVRDAVNNAAAEDMKIDDDNSNDDDDEEYTYEDDDDEDQNDAKPSSDQHVARLADMFAPPDDLIFKEGGFEDARNMAKDTKRWLLVNLQRDSEFSCHALNRDVWRDELVENLIREGFIFWQAMDESPEGKVYAQRYHVYDYPHIAFIDPRTRRLMWKKEGWTQEKPMTAELFAETAMDFCSRHSFDKPPVAPRPTGSNNRPAKRHMSEMSFDDQMQEAMRASLEESSSVKEAAAVATAVADGSGGDGDDEDIEFLGTSNEEDAKPKAEEKEPSMMDELIAMPLDDEPASGARIQLRMPDGKRKVRRFDVSKTVKTIYAFIAQSDDEAKGGKEFICMAGYPPKDLLVDIDNTIESCKLAGQAITVRWK